MTKMGSLKDAVQSKTAVPTAQVYVSQLAHDNLLPVFTFTFMGLINFDLIRQYILLL